MLFWHLCKVNDWVFPLCPSRKVRGGNYDAIVCLGTWVLISKITQLSKEKEKEKTGSNIN